MIFSCLVRDVDGAGGVVAWPPSNHASHDARGLCFLGRRTYRELGLHVGAAKPLYCAPELLVGPAKSDAAAMAADIWALGASLLECVRGASPFRGSDGPSSEASPAMCG